MACAWEDYRAISDLICRFQRSFDDHDHDTMLSCLDPWLDIDYSSFRDEPPARMTADDYVAARRTDLADLLLQHNHFNLQVSVDGDRGAADCNYAIFRFEREGPRYFHSWGRYRFDVRRADSGWRLAGITQHLLRNEGDPDLHGALRRH